MTTGTRKKIFKRIRLFYAGALVYGVLTFIAVVVLGRSKYLSKGFALNNITRRFDFRMRVPMTFDQGDISDEQAASGSVSNVTFRRESAESSVGELHVILLASKRTGSSFTGEILNQNPEVMYVFEPLHQFTFSVLKGNMEGDIFDSQSIEMLDRLFKCDFPSTPFRLELQNRFFCQSSLAFKETVCATRSKVNSSRETSGRAFADVCKRYKYRAFKTIRLYNLDLLRSLAVDPKLNLKIIHLVRDPRGIVNSRRKINDKNVDFIRKQVQWDETEDLCKDLAKNLHIVRSSPEWLKGTYILVRYEDIAKQPGETADKIYQFLGLSMPEKVRKWIAQNTKTSNNKKGHLAGHEIRLRQPRSGERNCHTNKCSEYKKNVPVQWRCWDTKVFKM
ncbi:carbohydrate sulfotransferase 1-like [Ptychodera flava]|uniref:carbohydrate sulfotransferase 1-like n=1 Tax=Ptychodera flava TaxID=63121 RepID=UPI00396A2925